MKESSMEELLRENEILRERIEVEVIERQRAQEALDRSRRELQEFAYIASHDLQEPLRKVQTFGKLLIEKQGLALDEQGKDYLERMVNATRRMSEMIESLLAYSRVATKGEPFRMVDLTRVVQDVVRDFQQTLERGGGRVEVGRLCEIEADPTQMRQLFRNLIGNALKFRKEGESPLVKLRCSPVNSGHYEIAVEDNGIGFDEKYLDRIFVPFQKLHGASSQYEGSGMGLAVCRRIVERHGGSITARSTPGRGATFIVRALVSQKGNP